MENKILEEMKKLELEFYKIQCRNWTPSLGNGKGASGITFEKLLGKNSDKLVLPDYNGIEIKTRSKYNTYPLHLFSCAFDNKPLEMRRLLQLVGYPDKTNPKFKVFQIRINGGERMNNGKYSYELFVNKKRERIDFFVFHRDTNQLVTMMSWSFKELKSRLEHKLNYLAIVESRRDRLKGKEYFKYDKITFYELKGFDTFLDLITSGSMSVTFRLSYYHDGEKYGEILDRGTTFDINYKDIAKLFEKVELTGFNN